jgi:hypothetical protein
VIGRALRFARRAVARTAKRARQRLHPRAGSASALFVVGAQRSGTTLLLDVLDAHREVWVYHEHHRGAFTRSFRLRPLAVRERLVARARCRWVAFKPLFDLQHLDRLLAEHPGSRAIFVVRDHRDAALSGAEKWGGALPRAVERLASEDPCTHWMADRLPPERRSQLAEFCVPALDAASAAALRWWLRSAIFFDLGLDARGDCVLPVRYEALARDPAGGVAALFAFLGLSSGAPAAAARVSARSVGRGRGVVLDPRVAALCRELEARLDAVIASPSRRR